MLLKDIESHAPDAICEVTATNVNRTMIVNRDKAPFDNADLRRAMSLTLDRKAFIDIITEGRGDIGATMLPGPEGVWGMPNDELQKLPSYDPDVVKNRDEACNLMQELGYGPDKRLPVTVSTRNIPPYRDPAVILIDQLSDRNYTGYCNLEVDTLVDRQSVESNNEKLKRLVWEIKRKLVEDDARPVIFYPRGATCRHPQVKGLTVMVNSIYNGYRYEDLWLDN
jgi:peptide/nickel transport system substrate-binding protein